MAIASLKFPRVNDTGRALRFTMSCKQVNVVKSETVAAIARSAAAGGQKKSDLGKQPPKAAGQGYKSMLKRLGESINSGVASVFTKGPS